MLTYPMQRQVFPEMITRTLSGVGAGSWEKVMRGGEHAGRAEAASKRMMSARGLLKRRLLVIKLHCEHERRTAFPSTMTVQAPHTLCSQPTCVTVRRKS